MQHPLVSTALALLLTLGLATGTAPLWPADIAKAQDGDDDDDDDGDDDDDDGGGDDDDDDDDDDDGARDDDDDARVPRPGEPGGGGGAPRVAPPPAPAERVTFAAGEIVTLALTAPDLALLLARGYRVLEERSVPEIGIVSRRLAIPDGTTLDEARAEVRALPSGSDADFNHYYRTEEDPRPALCEGPHCGSLDQIGWAPPPGTAPPCTADIAIGVIDTGINPGHATFAKARLDVHRLVPEDLDPSRAVHGTAVLSLIVGGPDSRSPGLLPQARVVAVDAFYREGGDERTDVYTLASAMDFLADRNVRVLNLSLAGPPNSVLEAAVNALAARGVLIIAAAGNGGPRAEPAYPAAYPAVVAVTAVDAGGRVYRRAGQGAHVDLAAPGVEVWTAASVSGARPKTGTSFAAPFVTAVAASILSQEPELTPEEVTARLTASARDLGDPGPDPVYGQGLVQAALPCQPTPPLAAAP